MQETQREARLEESQERSELRWSLVSLIALRLHTHLISSSSVTSPPHVFLMWACNWIHHFFPHSFCHLLTLLLFSEFPLPVRHCLVHIWKYQIESDMHWVCNEIEDYKWDETECNKYIEGKCSYLNTSSSYILRAYLILLHFALVLFTDVTFVSRQMQDPPPAKTLYLALLQWSGTKPAVSLRYVCILNICSDWQCKERNQGRSIIWAGFRSLNSMSSHWERKSCTSLGRNGMISA